VNTIMKFILVVMMILTAITGLSCSAGENTPVITIAYSGSFAGETPSGYLNLFIDVNIKNTGNEPFSTFPEKFSVIVEDYSYRPSVSDLQTVDLTNGDSINGTLMFQVPPVAATTKGGYKMEYSGTLQNINWVKQATPIGSPTVSDSTVFITYSDSYMWVKGTESLYLLIDMTIENRGYESFNTSPEFFTLLPGNILGQSTDPPPIKFDGVLTDERDGAFSNLRTYDLQNGGKLSGRLAFLVSREILSSTERYSLEYSGVRSYNIKWTWKPQQ
jgi:hypothetical protein